VSSFYRDPLDEIEFYPVSPRVSFSPLATSPDEQLSVDKVPFNVPGDILFIFDFLGLLTLLGVFLVTFFFAFV
jgi:hypothetical protein